MTSYWSLRAVRRPDGPWHPAEFRSHRTPPDGRHTPDLRHYWQPYPGPLEVTVIGGDYDTAAAELERLKRQGPDVAEELAYAAQLLGEARRLRDQRATAEAIGDAVRRVAVVLAAAERWCLRTQTLPSIDPDAQDLAEVAAHHERLTALAP